MSSAAESHLRPVPADSSDDWAVEHRVAVSGRGVLSAAEIEALLRPDFSDLDDTPAPDPEPAAAPRFDEDGTGPRGDARRLTSALSLAMRETCGLDAVAHPGEVRTAPFASAVAAVSRAGAALCFGPASGHIAAMLLIDSRLVFSLVDAACGGTGAAAAPAGRAVTAMEAGVLKGVLAPAAAAFGEDWRLVRVEHRPDYAAAFSPAGLARLVDISILHGGSSHAGALVVSDKALSDADPAPGSAPRADAISAVLTARLASLSVPSSRISALKPGDTLLLGVPADQPVELLSGGRDGPVAAEAEIGRKGAFKALRITRRGPILRGPA